MLWAFPNLPLADPATGQTVITKRGRNGATTKNNVTPLAAETRKAQKVLPSFH